MKRYEVARVTEAKYRDYVAQIVARLKSLPGDVWLRFAGGIQRSEPALFEEADRQVEQICLETVHSCSEPELKLLWFGSDAVLEHKDDNPGSRRDLELGVLRELHGRVRYAAGDASPEGDEKEKPSGDETAAGFRFADDDLVFLSKVARSLALLTAQPGLAPEKAGAVRCAVAALRKLPGLTPGINVQIEVAHRMGGGEFSESYSYKIKLDRQRIEISSSGSQSDPAVGSEFFTLESLQWLANGQAEHNGNRDTWLERLAYALARGYTLHVTDGSGDRGTSTV
jgi:hypothetical protein